MHIVICQLPLTQRWRQVCHKIRLLSCQNRTLNSSTSRTNHYKTLGLEQSCSTKDIRDAFVKLSKEVHPDRNPKDFASHAKFVELNEAYTVLAKPEARWQYDLSLTRTVSPNGMTSEVADHRPTWQNRNTKEYYTRTAFWDPNQKVDREEPYYGIKGVQKVPNWCIVIGCILFISVGVMGHYLAIRYNNKVSQEAQDRKDKLCSAYYGEAEKMATALGTRSLQIEMLEQRLKSSDKKS